MSSSAWSGSKLDCADGDAGDVSGKASASADAALRSRSLVSNSARSVLISVSNKSRSCFSAATVTLCNSSLRESVVFVSAIALRFASVTSFFASVSFAASFTKLIAARFSITRLCLISSLPDASISSTAICAARSSASLCRPARSLSFSTCLYKTSTSPSRCLFSRSSSVSFFCNASFSPCRCMTCRVSCSPLSGSPPPREASSSVASLSLRFAAARSRHLFACSLTSDGSTAMRGSS